MSARRASLVVCAVLLSCPGTKPPNVDDAGSDAGTDGGAPPDAGVPPGIDGGLSMKSACAVLNARRCEALGRCGLIDTSTIAQRDCLAFYSATWCGPSKWPSRADPSVATLRYDPIFAANCADGFATASCGAVQVLPPACNRFLWPNSYLGGPCYGNEEECAEGVCRGATCPMTCQALGQTDGACRYDRDCRAGLYCKLVNLSSGTSACASPATVDKTCDPSTPCAPGLSCIASKCRVSPHAGEACLFGACDDYAYCVQTTDGGTCESKRALGVSCSDDAQCVSGLCEPLSQVCKARLVPGDQDICSTRQTCGNDNVCVGASATTWGVCDKPVAEFGPCVASSDCEAHLACRRASDGGTCAARVPDGMACSEHRDCHLFSVCVSGVCQRLPLPGETCEVSKRCLYGPCLNTPDAGAYCQSPLGPGELCSSNDDCASARCVGGKCLVACVP